MSINQKQSNPDAIRSRLMALIAGLAKGLPRGVLTIEVNHVVLYGRDAPPSRSGRARSVRHRGRGSQRPDRGGQARDESEPDALKFLEGFDLSARATLGASSTALGDYGVKPKKARRKATIDELNVRKTKAAATRLARGTMSPKQKAKIKGTPPPPATPPPKP